MTGQAPHLVGTAGVAEASALDVDDLMGGAAPRPDESDLGGEAVQEADVELGRFHEAVRNRSGALHRRPPGSARSVWI